MAHEKTNTVIVGGGQAGLAMSAHLRDANVPHIVLERDRIAERWRTDRWDSLVANGPAWHDRFPAKEFDCVGPDAFPSKNGVVTYFEDFAAQIDAPIRCGVSVISVTRDDASRSYLVETNKSTIEAQNVVAATGPFQIPIIPPLIPEIDGIKQIHSSSYRNPNALDDGAVLVIGAGSSGSQIADELLRSGRKVYLSVGPHDRPPRSYRGKDFVWWLGVLGKWQMKTPPAGREHVTIAVSGAHGGETVDFRRFAERGMILLGMAQTSKNGVLSIAGDLAQNITEGDTNYLSVLKEADAYIEANELDMPPEEDAKIIAADPDCMTNPVRQLDLKAQGVTTILWATGYRQDFSWLNADTFHKDGRPDHHRGVSKADGIYFLGLPWLSMRGSSFIWGVWEDAKYLAAHIRDNGAQI